MENQIFKKIGEINLVNGGYLVSKKEETPLTNFSFVAAQERAEFIVTVAAVAKGKKLVSDKVTTVEEIMAEARSKMKTKAVTYLEAPKKPKGKLTAQLKEEALSFLSHTEEVSKASKINNFLQEFNIINEFETFGLFFTPGVVKLNKIYTMEEITKAVSDFIDILD